MDDNNFAKLMDAVKDIADGLTGGVNLVNPIFIQNFQEQFNRARANADEILNTNRSIKLGIVGQVKAGKSSFLNALIFNGRDILPHAATPMTAALTKIVHATQPFAKVVFYTKQDWEIIVECAEKYGAEYNRLYEELEQRRRADWERKRVEGRVYGDFKFNFSDADKQSIKNQIHPKYVACNELIEMASDDILHKLDSQEEISIGNLDRDLKNYVGAEGKYTPIVKWIELGINSPLVENIEIVDTPGLGDPILSRGQKTKEFLMQCDLVFMLSTTPQFMNQQDIELMIHTLPGESVGHALLVGSKFDSVLCDYPSRKKIPFNTAAKNTAIKLNNQAVSQIDKCLKMNCGYVGASILNQMKSDMPPYYISSVFYGAAKNIDAHQPLSELEEIILTQLSERFDGFKRDDPKFLLDMAGIDELKQEEFTKIQRAKDKLIAEKQREFAKTQRRAFLRQLEDILIEAERNRQQTQDADIGALNKQLEQSQRALSDMRSSVRTTFEGCAVDARRYMINLANDIKTFMRDHTSLNISENTRTVDRTREESFLIFFTRTKHYTEVEHYKTATVADVLTNINGFINTADQFIGRNLGKAINTQSIAGKVKATIDDALQKSNADFDANNIRNFVDVGLSKMTLPPFQIVDRKKYEQMILDKFSQAYVESEDIHRLVQEQGVVLRAVLDDIVGELERKANDIDNMLDEQAAFFIDDVRKQIETKIELLKSNVQNREQSIRDYDEFLRRLQQYKDALRQGD